MNDTAPLSVRVADEQNVTYYDLPSVKPSLWGGLVSGCMFVSGVGGSAQIIATAAHLVGDRGLEPIVRNGRYLALGAAVVGGPLLIIDLHTPQRWYNMLRIFRKTSPMSIGTWVLMSFEFVTELIAKRREGEPGARLDRCNASLSMIIGGEYPLAGLRRDRLQKARDELAMLLGER